jgi:hypothetical protein
MPGERVIYLPEAVIEDLLGRRLAQAIGQEFEYNGQRYRARQRDPSRPEAEVLCELIEPPQEIKPPRGRGRQFRQRR